MRSYISSNSDAAVWGDGDDCSAVKHFIGSWLIYRHFRYVGRGLEGGSAVPGVLQCPGGSRAGRSTDVASRRVADERFAPLDRQHVQYVLDLLLCD